ncbi:MAG: 16S rRNA (guanine(527)-N(7))-methyltransferase RsmG [Myxococcota bacterium]
MTQPPWLRDPGINLYLQELVTWGGRMNLVGSTQDNALRRHLEECLAAAPELPRGARVVDLGSGAGLPGLPLQIRRRDLQVTLVESRARRVHFLRHVARELSLECVILHGRIEELQPRPHDYALLRAVAPLERSLELARPWVCSGGEIWVWTRETLSGPAHAGEIPLGSRGRILRVHVADVSRGTL